MEVRSSSLYIMNYPQRFFLRCSVVMFCFAKFVELYTTSLQPCLSASVRTASVPMSEASPLTAYSNFGSAYFNTGASVKALGESIYKISAIITQSKKFLNLFYEARSFPQLCSSDFVPIYSDSISTEYLSQVFCILFEELSLWFLSGELILSQKTCCKLKCYLNIPGRIYQNIV